MKQFVATLLFCLTVSVAEARPLLITLDPYVSPASVVGITLYRNENRGSYRPIATITNLSAPSYLDRDVKHNRTYCYRAQARTATGKTSGLSSEDCERPNK